MQVNILEAKNRLSELVKAAASGEEVIIANRGKPVAKLVRAEETSERKKDDRQDIDRRLAQYLANIDRIPDRPDSYDPLEWDEHGLPK